MVTYHLTSHHCQLWRPGCPAPSNKHEAAVSFGAHCVATIHLKFIGFNAVEFLQSENTFVLKEALRYHKHLSTRLIAVGAIIIDKSLVKPVKTRGVNVSTKQ